SSLALILVAAVVCSGCAGGGGSTTGVDAAHKTVAGSSADWTRFGWDARRSNDGSLVRQQIHLPGTADSSPIYLHGVSVNGATHDAFFVTTTYGITLAIDADDGSILWQWKPSGYSKW